jgi:hypothetical protein
LVADLISEGVNASVSRTIRETVQAVATLQAVTPGGVSLPQLVKALKLDRSSVSRRAKDAHSKGYLANEETQPGKPARWVVGEPLPDDIEVLPPPEKLGCLQCCIGKRGYPEQRLLLLSATNYPELVYPSSGLQQCNGATPGLSELPPPNGTGK